MPTFGTPQTFAEWQAIIDTANLILPLSGTNGTVRTPSFFFAIPPLFIVPNVAGMVKMHKADWGERPGGVVVRRDDLSAWRLTGADHRDPSAWTLFPACKVALTSTTLLGPATAGLFGVVLSGSEIGIYLPRQGFWARLSPTPNARFTNATQYSEMLLGLFVESVPPARRYLTTGGESYALLNYPLTPEGFTEGRYTFTSPLPGLRHRDIDFYSPSPNPVVHATATIRPAAEYDTTSTTTAKILLRNVGLDMEANGKIELLLNVAVTPTLTLTLTPSTPGVTASFTPLGPTTGYAQIVFAGAPIPVGDLDLQLATSAGTFARGSPGYFSSATITLSRIFQGNSVPADDEAIALTTTYKLPIQKTALTTRYYVKGPRPTFGPPYAVAVPPGFPATIWIDLGGPTFTRQTPGLFLAKRYAIDEVLFDPPYTDPNGPHFPLTDSPRTGKTWTIKPGTTGTAVGAEFIIPRAYFRRDTDTPNQLYLDKWKTPGTWRVSPGSMIYEIHARRLPTQPAPGGTTNLQPTHWNPVTFAIGYMRAGNFLPLGAPLTIPADTWSLTLKTEWPNLESLSLAYQSDEPLDLQCRLTAIDTLGHTDIGSRRVKTYEHPGTITAALTHP